MRNRIPISKEKSFNPSQPLLQQKMRWYKIPLDARAKAQIPYVTWPGQPIRIEVTPPCASRQGRDVPIQRNDVDYFPAIIGLWLGLGINTRLARPEMNGRTLQPQREDKDAGDVSKLV